MSERIFNVRVRPARAAVLISQDADQQALLLAFEFFSRIWGGRFGQILAVDPRRCDDLTVFRLGRLRPEFVYGIGLDDELWGEAVCRVCQPRRYARLQSELWTLGRQYHPEDYILSGHALVHLRQTAASQGGRKRILRLVGTEESSLWRPYCAAMFGHHPNLRRDLYDEYTMLAPDTVKAFVDLAAGFVKDSEQSYLDVTGHALDTVRITDYFAPFLAPTVVLVRSPVPDLSLFWNLRMQSDVNNPAWIIPIPVTEASDTSVLDSLKQWLLAFLRYGSKPNYCLVTSASVNEEGCQDFATKFKDVLSGTAVEFVDYEPPGNRTPVVVPFEYEAAQPVDISDRRLTIQPPRPRTFSKVGSSAWCVDLCKDMATGRAVEELQPPSSPVVFEILNGPCPPSLESSLIPRMGVGSEHINIRCSGKDRVVNVYLPTSEEIITEMLRECGVEPTLDEKRSSYLPVIERFGGLFQAASAFRGQSREVLNTLIENTKTPDEIRGLCKLGKGRLGGESYLQRVEAGLFSRMTKRLKRISRRRFQEYAGYKTPEDMKLQSVLEHWADQEIVTRYWKIGPCKHCRQHDFVSTLNIQKKVICTHCGHRIRLPMKIPIGYTLHRAVRHAISEGIMPVVLTGQFLRGLTDQGFFWLPGVKYEADETLGDIDIIACCDGHLVFCECKSLAGTQHESEVWKEVIDQFVETAAIAGRCGGHLVVLAALVDDFPKEVQEDIKGQLGNRIPYLLLNKSDLDSGHREIREPGSGRWLRIGDLLPLPFPEQPRDRGEDPRTIALPWGGTFTR